MFRTFLIVTREPHGPPEMEQVLCAIAELYGSRVIVADVRSSELLAGPGRAEIAPATGIETGSAAVRSPLIIVGDFVPAVCDKGHEADVIVVWHETLTAKNGERSNEELASLVRHAPRPVWVFREPVRRPEHILVAYDGSAHSGRALHMGANLAETLGARLSVLNVDESRDEVAQELTLARAARYCEAYRVTMDRVGLFGTAAESIRSYAGASQGDLMVVGAAGVGYLRGLLFGSVAGQLVANAPCSVLVAK
jgi:nucleotide-binding universal stress UspA family protein